ncbi:MAG: M23 family metallopeptidase [Gemmatimonadetes bacterium]|nr:M23 family metallopeptidase [Gemmatimonadota bacterium]
MTRAHESWSERLTPAPSTRQPGHAGHRRVRASAWCARRASLLPLALAACIGTPPPEPQRTPQRRPLPPALPDESGWGVPVLTLEIAPNGSLWAGTFGEGIYVLPPQTRDWVRIEPAQGNASSISWAFVNSISFPRDGSVWYGTVGNGFGRSTDGGRTWENWTQDTLGPQWQYVAHRGIRSRGDTVYIATADGLRLTWDAGTTWRCVVAATPVSGAAAQPADGCTDRIAALPSEYLLAMDVGPAGDIWVGHMHGLSVSRDAGRTWTHPGDAEGVPARRVRAVTVTPDSMVWFATEEKVYVDSLTGEFVEATIRLPGWNGLPGGPRAIVPTPGASEPSIVLSHGLAAGDGFGNFRMYYIAAGDQYRPSSEMWSMAWSGPPLWPIGGSSVGLARVLAGEGPGIDATRIVLAAPPGDARHSWFTRPIVDGEGNPYIDGTYRYGSTMGGNFQQHQGIEFNNPAGTPVHAIGDGVIAFAGEAEAGSRTVAILHDRRWQDRFVWSTYYHNSSLDVQVGQRVSAGDVIARVGNTGRATNDHVHLEVHVTPAEDVTLVVNPAERFPPHTVNPEFWLQPLPGTGVIAGRVTDGAGRRVAGVRVYGLVWPYPAETPFLFAETYGDRAHADPAYDENFAIGDVPAGIYLLGAYVDGQRVWRRARVEAGKVTFIEFTP